MIEQQSRKRHFVQSLERGLAVIRALSQPGPGLTLSEVADRAGLSRAAARRFLLTLVDLGYVRGTGRQFALTPLALELGYAYLSGLGLPEVAQPHLRALVERIQESSSVSVLDGTEIVYVAREPTRRIMSVTIDVGTRLPAHLTSMGRVLLAALSPTELSERLEAIDWRRVTDRSVTDRQALLAELDKVRSQGYAIVDQELEAGLRSAGAPIRNGGRIVAAINISTHAHRTALEHIRGELLPPLLQTAERIGRELPAVGPQPKEWP